jgi:hypothetical protein
MDVLLDPVLKQGKITRVHVNFQACARTNWHKSKRSLRPEEICPTGKQNAGA